MDIITFLLIDELFDIILGIIKFIIGPVLGIIGVICFLGGCSAYPKEGSGSVISFGLILMGIWFFGLGEWIVDTILLIIGICLLLLVFGIVWTGLERTPVIVRFIFSVGATILIIALSPILAFIPFLNIEGSMISNATKSVYRIESKVASNVSKYASKAGSKVTSNISKYASKTESKIISSVEGFFAKNKTKEIEKAARQIEKKEASEAIKSLQPKNILTKEKKEAIMSNTGWSPKIVNSIGSELESKIYQNAKLQERIVNGKECLVTKINWKRTDQYGRTNRERGKLGLAPLDEKGNPIELHHIGQKENSPLAELTMQEHRGKGNDSILHDKTKETEIDRGKFASERIEHWEARATEGE